MLTSITCRTFLVVLTTIALYPEVSVFIGVVVSMLKGIESLL